MEKVTTTVQILKTTRDECRKRGIKLRYLVERGWQSINNETGQSTIIKEQGEKIERMSRLISSQQRQISDVHNRLDK
jgi:hypothetical protein